LFSLMQHSTCSGSSSAFCACTKMARFKLSVTQYSRGKLSPKVGQEQKERRKITWMVSPRSMTPCFSRSRKVSRPFRDM
jgi:hypothetical protein